jgi:hypothetical protein
MRPGVCQDNGFLCRLSTVQQNIGPTHIGHNPHLLFDGLQKGDAVLV